MKHSALKEIYLAGGCFWGIEHYLKQVTGVTDTEVGYANGHTANPTYEQVCTGRTGFVETVHVTYDPRVLPLRFLLELYFKAIDPTIMNSQGMDIGTQYRTGVYYVDDMDETVIRALLAQQQSNYADPIVVECLPLTNFYPAEAYHQDYLEKNPHGYCHLPEELFRSVRKAKPQK